MIDNTISKLWNTNSKTLTLSATESKDLDNVFGEVQCLLLNCQTKPEIETCDNASFLTSVYDYKSKFFDVKPESQIDEKSETSETSPRDELVKSKSMSAECTKIRRSIKKQISQTEFETLPEITIRNIDGSITRVKEKQVPIDSERNISMKETQDIDTKENRYVKFQDLVRKSVKGVLKDSDKRKVDPLPSICCL